MAKINISFNDVNYSIDESAFADASAKLQYHLSNTMNGTGASVNLGGLSYNIDATKLSAATSDFVSHLGTVAGSGYKVMVGGVEYGVGADKVSGAMGELEIVLGELEFGGQALNITDENAVLTIQENEFGGYTAIIN